ncbi:aspartate ammonia-lyase [Desulfocucumis palustris]|uniref:Aspartate ammonia-lyase n=1 Tax=Desulfocucumis palustris TaxID=1898651 RepID=A0A2L2X8M4_9FIRM|nr:aspartate ammonia-lyase [Desulfocucumis palustris]GBF32569.1 aspartate ammonia-lyase [Desulfocucumis palustris]
MYRTEQDLLGFLDIPAEAYYGIHTARSRENFNITGIPVDREIIMSLALVKRAAALANMELGRLEGDKGGAIARAAAEVAEGNFMEQFSLDSIQGGAGTSINMNVNEVIANRAIELLGGQKGDYGIVSPNDHVNMAQSTNDVLPTAIHIALLNKTERLADSLGGLIEALGRKAEEFDGVVKTGRTHLQDAVPIRLGQEFSAYSAVMKRSLNRVTAAAGGLREINLGATAVGTGLNAGRRFSGLALEHLCAITGHRLFRAVDLVDATQNQDVLLELSGALRELAVMLSKIAGDLRLMSSGPRCGFGEMTLPEVQAGSSIMPGKINPVIPETVNQVCFQVLGNDLAVSLAMQAGQLELNVMSPVTVYNLVNSLHLLTNAIAAFDRRCVRGIKANAGRCGQLVEKSLGLLTALVPRIGYKEACSAAREAGERGDSPVEVLLRRNLLTREELAELLSPLGMTTPGGVEGDGGSLPAQPAEFQNIRHNSEVVK